jgi:hypothetical protein
MVAVLAAKVKRGHVVTVQFADGHRRDIDLVVPQTGCSGLREEARFRELRVQDGSIAWPNGADICPDVLYYDLPLAGELQTPASALRLRRFLESPVQNPGPASNQRSFSQDSVICWFLGITISVNYRKKSKPHFHASYAEFSASFEIDSLRELESNLPPRVARLVREWAALHRKELAANWDRARRGLPLKPIAPLE